LDRLPILVTPGVARIIGIGRTPIAVPDYEIEGLRAIQQSGLNYAPWPYLQAGHMVRIEGGPLRDLEGILLSFKNRTRIIVSVTLLQRSVAAEVDIADVTPVAKASEAAPRRAPEFQPGAGAHCGRASVVAAKG
jgi:transcription antitermination factor NusG